MENRHPADCYCLSGTPRAGPWGCRLIFSCCSGIGLLPVGLSSQPHCPPFPFVSPSFLRGSGVPLWPLFLVQLPAVLTYRLYHACQLDKHHPRIRPWKASAGLQEP